jgi:CRP-like cAMP-binding protein
MNTSRKPACRAGERCPFCRVSDDDWNLIESRTLLSSFDAGIALFEEGDHPAGVHLICGGRVNLWCSDSEGRRFAWRLAEAGDTLGAMTLLLDMPYSITAETGQPCLIRFIPKDFFFQLMGEHHLITRHLLLQTGARLYWTLDQLREFVFCRSALQRLALLLFRLWAEKQGPTGDGEPRRIYMSREEMAERIGVDAPETVSRLLAQLVKRGIIERDRGVTIILKPDQLKLIE